MGNVKWYLTVYGKSVADGTGLWDLIPMEDDIDKANVMAGVLYVFYGKLVDDKIYDIRNGSLIAERREPGETPHI